MIPILRGFRILRVHQAAKRTKDFQVPFCSCFFLHHWRAFRWCPGFSFTQPWHQVAWPNRSSSHAVWPESRTFGAAGKKWEDGQPRKWESVCLWFSPCFFFHGYRNRSNRDFVVLCIVRIALVEGDFYLGCIFLKKRKDAWWILKPEKAKKQKMVDPLLFVWQWLARPHRRKFPKWPEGYMCLMVSLLHPNQKWWYGRKENFKKTHTSCSPQNLGKISNVTIIFFQMGWFNHQP